MDYDWLNPYYRENNGRTGADPAALVKMSVLEHPYGLAEQLRKRSARGREIYALQKEVIEQVFADAEDKHEMPYPHRGGLACFLDFSSFSLIWRGGF